ncbi:MAG TPA: hypothetical protein VGQ87_03115 [Patescibacteria group bacterium]|nr:hypothetical protein [Patescibacteria group bacterium]
MPNDVRYIERDTSSSAGVWAVIAVLIVLFALLLFGSNLFRSRNTSTDNTNIRGTIETPSSGTSGTQ